MLSPEKIEEFRHLMKEECGVDLSYEEAASRASQLINMFRMLMGAIPEDPQAHVVPETGGVKPIWRCSSGCYAACASTQ